MPISEADQADGEGPDGDDKPPLDSTRHFHHHPGSGTPVRASRAFSPAQMEYPLHAPGKAASRHSVAHDKSVVMHPQQYHSHPSQHIPNGACPPFSMSPLATALPSPMPAPQPRRPTHNAITSPSRPAPSRRTPSGRSSSEDSSSDSESGNTSTASSRPSSRNYHRVSESFVKQAAAGYHEDPNTAAPAPPSAPPSRPPSVRSLKSDDGSHRFNLKDLIGSGVSLRRKNSARSDSSGRKSDSDVSSACAPDSTASLLKKYGVCGRVAIGKGATSVVRLAHKWDRSEEKLYAVKEFRKRRKNETEKEYVKKLTSEFCISSTLHHSNIVETVDLVQDENQHWCEVMEFCPGGDLYAAIKKGGMSPVEIECCFKQILSGVAYLHSQGVAHRDIKPENLFFDGKGHLKIGDYGASTVYRLPWESTVHLSTGLCGSEPYIAPEQFTNQPYDARLVDVWACGIVYYCMHFHELPWRVAQCSDPLYASYASACAASPTNCPATISLLQPRACRPLLRKMLEPDPKQRALIDAVMNHPWIQGIEVCTSGKPPKHTHVQVCTIPQGS